MKNTRKARKLRKGPPHRPTSYVAKNHSIPPSLFRLWKILKSIYYQKVAYGTFTKIIGKGHHLSLSQPFGLNCRLCGFTAPMVSDLAEHVCPQHQLLHYPSQLVVSHKTRSYQCCLCVHCLASGFFSSNWKTAHEVVFPHYRTVSWQTFKVFYSLL